MNLLLKTTTARELGRPLKLAILLSFLRALSNDVRSHEGGAQLRLKSLIEGLFAPSPSFSSFICQLQ